ncbi:hypothetical protein IWW42_002952 [Coemansia sp. RSA 1085]|nr:hypothetical protein IWW42_002952 [Coemansia sp. RSA 1085]
MLFVFGIIALALIAIFNIYAYSLSLSNIGQNAPTFTLKRTALDSSKVPFTSHSLDTPFGSYLQQTLDYAPFSDLFESINATTGTLQTRGEAHVTVVTPPEFDRVLKPAGVTIEEIDDIAKQANIQLSRLTPVCVGRFKGSLPNPKVDADKGTFLLYSLVVADEFGELLAIRKRVFELYLLLASRHHRL